MMTVLVVAAASLLAPASGSAQPARESALALATPGVSAPARTVAPQLPPDSASLARAIAAVVDAGALARAHWGIEVLDVGTGRVLYERNGERLFVPASNLKLVVSAAAAHYLGPDFRFRTSFLRAGQVVDSTLQGALVVRGTGDPTLSGRYQPELLTLFTGFADSLRAHGVNRITGGVVADVSFWPDEPVLGDWQSYDLNWWYAAHTGPLGFNDNSIDFRVAPGPAVGQPASITWQPDTRAFTFENRTRTVAAGQPQTLDFDRVPGTDSIFAYGVIPLGTAARTEYFAVRDPALYAGTVLAETLARAGIAIAAGSVSVSHDSVPAQPLFDYQSPPLPQLVGPVLRNSQNWFAEQLLKTIGKQQRDEGSWHAGLDAETRFLHDVVGIDSAAFRLRDASGLSTGNLIAPAALARLVRYVASTPRERVALEALPVGAAQTGSLRSRFADLPGRVRAKTGSIRNVASLSGLVHTDSGRELAFSIIANGTGLATGRVTTAIDAVVRVLAAQ